MNSIIVNTEVSKNDLTTDDITKDLEKLKAKVEKKTIGIDFGKYPTLSD